MSIIVLGNKNVSEIIQRAIKKKADAYKFLIRNGLLKEANYTYHEWKALIEIAELLGLKFKSIANVKSVKIAGDNLSLTKDQLEKLVILIYFHFNRYKLLHIREFEKMIINIIENE
ncbi:MAG: hypothetical protein ACFFAK_16320 [Promethearchaeota archaeon]